MVSPVVPLICAILVLSSQVESLPLSTNGRWITDSQSGKRVKLHCANWVGHMPALIPEGLHHKPVGDIASKVSDSGFNCVRLTWAIDMVVRPENQNLTVAQSFERLKWEPMLEGVKKNNPTLVDVPVLAVFDAVVKALGDAGVMVILDNHVSKSMWCCALDDGNGFFGDEFFNPDEWTQGLKTMATHFRNTKTVIGMSLRNELRGPRSNVPDWYTYMFRGANTVHEVNPDVLVIVSGLNFDCDLSFLHGQRFPGIANKTVFEAHWYAFSEGRAQEWADNNPNTVCPGVTQRFIERIGFVSQPAPNGLDLPLFISEYGYDQRGVEVAGNRYLPCFFAYAMENDVDWALWTMQGSYYWRQEQFDFEETYGVLDSAWNSYRDPSFEEKFELLQTMIFDPSSPEQTRQIIFHPLTGQCLTADFEHSTVQLSGCGDRSAWSYGDGSRIDLLDAGYCLEARGVGAPVGLVAGSNCGVWKDPGTARLQLGSAVAGAADDDQLLCMESSPDGVVTKLCSCVSGDTCQEANVQVQWFKVLDLNVARKIM